MQSTRVHVFHVQNLYIFNKQIRMVRKSLCYLFFNVSKYNDTLYSNACQVRNKISANVSDGNVHGNSSGYVCRCTVNVVGII